MTGWAELGVTFAAGVVVGGGIVRELSKILITDLMEKLEQVTAESRKVVNTIEREIDLEDK